MERSNHAALAALALGLLAPLAGTAAEPRYTYIEGGYQYVDIDAGPVDVDGDGFEIGGSLPLADQVFLRASYSSTDLDFGVDAEMFTAGIGGFMPLRSDLHLIGTVGYGWAELDTPGGRDPEDDGVVASGGLRWIARPQLELTGELTYSDFDDTGDELSVTLGALYNLTPDLALELDVTFGDDVTRYMAGLRYYIPGRR